MYSRLIENSLTESWVNRDNADENHILLPPCLTFTTKRCLSTLVTQLNKKWNLYRFMLPVRTVAPLITTGISCSAPLFVWSLLGSQKQYIGSQETSHHLHASANALMCYVQVNSTVRLSWASSPVTGGWNVLFSQVGFTRRPVMRGLTVIHNCNK